MTQLYDMTIGSETVGYRNRCNKE